MDNIEFLTNIANGFNPYTGEKFSDSDMLLAPKVQERLIELIEELKKDCEYEKSSYGKPIPIIAPSTTIQPFAKVISNALYNAYTFSVIQSKILNYLLDDGKLYFDYEYETSDRMKKFATEEGKKIGITNEITIDPYGRKKHTVVYSVEAQEYIIDNLVKIFKYDN